MAQPTKEEIARAVNASREAALAIGAVIKAETEQGALKGVPAGHLYAKLMHQINHEQFEFFVGLLVQAKLVRRMPSHLLVWIGPAHFKP